MNDSQIDGAEDVVSIMQGILSEYLSPSALADDYKSLTRTNILFKQAVRDEKKIRSSCDEEKRSLEIEIAHSKTKLSEVKADCERLKAELSYIKGENVKLAKEETNRKSHIQELKNELIVQKIAQLKQLKSNSERNLNVAMNEIRKLEMKIEARSVGEFPLNDSQKLAFDNGNLRIQTVTSH